MDDAGPSSEPDEGVAWIRVIPEEAAEGDLAALYDEHRTRQTGSVDNILKIHSLHPETLADHARLYRTLMYGKGALSRSEREVIGVVVSVENRCHY